MRSYATLFAAVLSIPYVAHMKRIRMDGEDATKTEAARGVPVVGEHHRTGVANMGLANMGLADMGLADMNPYSAPTALQPPPGNNWRGALFQTPARKNRWQDLHGGFSEGSNAQVAHIVMEASEAMELEASDAIKSARTGKGKDKGEDKGQDVHFMDQTREYRWQDLRGGFVDHKEKKDGQADALKAQKKLAKAKSHILKAKGMQQLLLADMSEKEAEANRAQHAWNQAKRQKETESWKEAPAHENHSKEKAEKKAEKAWKDVQNARNGMKEVSDGMKDVKAEIHTAKAELGVAEKLQNEAYEQQNHFVPSESKSEAVRASEELRHLADRHSHAISRLNDLSGDFWETPIDDSSK